MSHRLDSLLLRGVFGVVLGLAAIGGAATQALSLDLEWRVEQGRLVWSSAAAGEAQCAVEAPQRERDAVVI